MSCLSNLVNKPCHLKFYRCHILPFYGYFMRVCHWFEHCTCSTENHFHIHNHRRKYTGLTFTILSAYFISHETNSPEDPRFNRTSHVVTVYPLRRRCHHGPFSNPTLKSSIISRAVPCHVKDCTKPDSKV